MKRMKNIILCCLVASLIVGSFGVVKLPFMTTYTIRAEEGNDTPDNPEPSVEVSLGIDNEHVYEGMKESYADGYIPVVENGSARVVVPILCKTGAIKANQINVEFGLGGPDSNPFVNRNYRKTVRMQEIKDPNGKVVRNVYLINTNLELKADRINGSYPVDIMVSGDDESGKTFSQTFTIYVTISDGINPNAEPSTEATTEEAPTFAPKILVDSVKVNKGKIEAGDEILVTVTLKNTSKSEAVKNMAVTVSAPSEHFSILSASDTIYVDGIRADGTADITVSYLVNSSTPQGQYNLVLAMEYADTKGAVYSGSVNAKLDVVQPVSVEFDALQYVNSAKLGETIDITMTAMNLGRGKVYNVRGVIECDGIEPTGTIFIGEMEPGSKKNAAITAYVTSLKNGKSDYGTGEGTITYYYEDELGNTCEQKEVIQMTVNSPFTEPTNEVQDEPNHWWILVAALLGVIVVIGVVTLIRKGVKDKHDSETDSIS